MSLHNDKLTCACDSLLNTMNDNNIGFSRVSAKSRWDRKEDDNPYFSHSKQTKRAKKYFKKLNKFWKEAKKKYRNNYKDLQGGIWSDLFKAKKTPLSEEQWNDIFTGVIDKDKLTEVYNDTFVNELGVSYKEVIKNTISIHALDSTLLNSFPPSDVLDEFAKYQLKFAEATTEKVSTSLKNIIKFGLEDGLSNQNISKNIMNKFDRVSEFEAMRISRTETIRASARGAISAYNRLGVKKYEILPSITACPICVDRAAGNPYLINDDYGRAPIHPNCYLHHSIKIVTDKGIKTINKICVGDNVLTHMGRYRKVTSVLDEPDRYNGDAVSIRYKGRIFGETNTRNSQTTTPEHPFLTQRGWVQAKDIMINDFLYVVANKFKVLDSGGAEFINVQVLETEYKKNFQGERLYNFSVDEDESYIANGVVSHNCRCTTIPVIGKQMSTDKEFPF